MDLRINDAAPDFEADTTLGRVNFYNFIGEGWAVLFSHPKDFTPVCATELGAVAALKDQFEKRNCKVMGLSVDRVENHLEWQNDIEDISGAKLEFPIIADDALEVSKLYGMLPNSEGSTSEGRTAVDNQTVRMVFIVGPDRKIKALFGYPMSTGRNFDEVLRVIDSCQLTAKKQVATPVNWKQGEPVVILPSISDEDAKELFPNGWDAVKPYLRKVKDPSS